MNYTTTDVNLGAYLVVVGFPLIRVDSTPGSPRRGVLHFRTEAKAAATDYFAGGKVPAKQYTATLREVKARIRHELHNQ
jgi:hypothetical protein